VANIAAAEKYSLDHLQSDAIQALVDKAQVIYICCFFISVSTESMVALGKHAASHNKVGTRGVICTRPDALSCCVIRGCR